MRQFVRRVLFLSRAEVLHVVRDRATVVQIVVLPIIQLLLLSHAATFQIRDTPLYVVDYDGTSTSRGLVSRFAASGHFRLIGQSMSPAAANDAMLRGQATLVLTIPRDFEPLLVRTGVAPVHLDLNAEKGSAAGVVQAYAATILQSYARELEPVLRPTIRTVRADPDAAAPMRGATRIETRLQNWYNPTIDYKHYIAPGILVALVTMIGTLLTAQRS